MKRILVVRPDRLGDVILSTPVFAALKARFPEARVTALVRENVMPLLKGLPALDDVMVYAPEGRHAGWDGLRRLATELRSHSFDCAVVLQSQRRVAAAIFMAGIPERIGPRSKIHSYVFYNQGIRQHRSRVEMHEADYNLALLAPLGISVEPRSIPTRVFVSESTREAARAWLNEHGWRENAPLVVVHPGMGGSALNWPEENYIELIRRMLAQCRQVLVTGGAGEGELLKRVQKRLEGVAPGKAIFYGGAESRGLDFLAGLYSWATVVVAPSTGPLHVAVALKRRVVTFFPPIRVQSAKRWGPYVSDRSRASVLVPDLSCEEHFGCREQLCKSYPCMRNVTVQSALEKVEQQLASELEGS